VRVTTESIAQKLNISRGTVSRALNGTDGVNKDTRKKVLEMAKTLGYIPNQAARCMAMKNQSLIGIIVFSEPDYFWKEIRKGVERAAIELHDYGVMLEYIVTEITRPEEQIKAIDDLVRRGAKGIAISPNNHEIIADYIDKVSEQGIPVITFSSDIPHSRRLCYVGPDYIQSGKLAAELMGKFLNNRGKVAIITFEKAVISIQERIIGFRQVIGKYPEIEILGPYKLSRTGENVYEFTQKLLEENKDIKGIFMTYGKLEIVGKAIKDLSLNTDIKVVGFDISDDIIELLQQGILDVVVGQEPASQGYLVAKILHNHIFHDKRPCSSIINTKLEVIVSENSYYYKDGTLNTDMILHGK
jgi:LacI family transcriptional regulator